MCNTEAVGDDHSVRLLPHRVVGPTPHSPCLLRRQYLLLTTLPPTHENIKGSPSVRLVAPFPNASLSQRIAFPSMRLLVPGVRDASVVGDGGVAVTKPTRAKFGSPTEVASRSPIVTIPFSFRSTPWSPTVRREASVTQRRSQLDEPIL